MNEIKNPKLLGIFSIKGDVAVTFMTVFRRISEFLNVEREISSKDPFILYLSSMASSLFRRSNCSSEGSKLPDSSETPLHNNQVDLGSQYHVYRYKWSGGLLLKHNLIEFNIT